MPANPKTTHSKIIQAARQLVELKGRDGFSMNDIAERVGIRAPSLYNRFRDRSSLLGAVELQLITELGSSLNKAITGKGAAATLVAQAQALRSFAKTNPNGYSLLFDVQSVPREEATAARAAALAALMPSLAALAGEKDAFLAARVLIPYIHGFVSMELANAFRLGEGVDAAFATGVATILRGIG